MSIDLGAIQAQQEAADNASVTIEGDALTRQYVRELESVAEDVPALLAYARDLEARLNLLTMAKEEADENCCCGVCGL